ncbi:MAG: flagellar hook-length control protein FliK [Dehalococcoidia bacterium]|nr:flagellar hook-length control protein FliK [Dehalococcoidia bacterium]
MGLVVQAPADTLLATTGLPTVAAGQPLPAAPCGDVFASLLASLSGSFKASCEENIQLPNPSGIELLPSAEDADPAKGAGGDPLAALLAMGIPIVVPQPAPASVAPPVEASARTVSPAKTGSSETYSRIEHLPIEPVAMEPAAPAPPPSQSAAAIPDEPTGQAESAAQSVEMLPPSENIVAGAPGPGAPPPRPAAPGPVTEAPSEGSQPGATSVVRSVGNAQKRNDTASDTEAGEDEHAGPGHRPDRPQPRASAQGIAHAAPNSAVGEFRPTTEAPETEAVSTVPVEASEVPPQVDQVASTVIETVDAGGGEARIHLDPADLGEVTIHVRTNGDTVHVEVRAERQEAMQLLRDHTQDLSNLLGERGLNLSDVNVGLGRGDQGRAWGEASQREDRGAAGEFASILGGDDGAAIEIHQRLRAAYNPDGALVYRV